MTAAPATPPEKKYGHRAGTGWPWSFRGWRCQRKGLPLPRASADHARPALPSPHSDRAACIGCRRSFIDHRAPCIGCRAPFIEHRTPCIGQRSTLTGALASFIVQQGGAIVFERNRHQRYRLNNPKVLESASRRMFALVVHSRPTRPRGMLQAGTTKSSHDGEQPCGTEATRNAKHATSQPRGSGPHPYRAIENPSRPANPTPLGTRSDLTV